MAEYIDRQAAKEQLVKTCNDVADKLYEWEGCFGYSDAVMGIVDCIDAIPAADVVERKRGKWIIEPYHIDGDIYVHRCSICMKEAMLGSNKVRMNFCPNCGSYNGGEE